MKALFNEDNTMEQMIISILKENGWTYIPAEKLPRMYSDVMVEPMVKEALIQRNLPVLTRSFISFELLFCLYSRITW